MRSRKAFSSVLARQPGRNRECERPQDGIHLIVRHEKHAIAHAVDAVELVIEIGQRSTLAGDVDHIGAAPVKDERLLVLELDQVGERDFNGDVPAANPHLVADA